MKKSDTSLGKLDISVGDVILTMHEPAHHRLENLVSPHIARMQELKDNELFWKLVEQCEDAISYAASAGLELTFTTSHSGFGRARNKVMLMIADIPCGIEVTDDRLDEGKFRVLERGMQRRDIKSGSDLLKFVKSYIG